MGTSASVPQLVGKISTFPKALGAQTTRALRTFSTEGRTFTQGVIASHLGGKDHFSGWPSAPIRISGKAGADFAVVQPTGRGRGPARVLDRGRHQGSVGGFHGPGINRKTGVTRRTKKGAVAKVRAVKRGRWNGVTQGTGAWGEASAGMAELAVRTVVAPSASRALKEVFG